MRATLLLLALLFAGVVDAQDTLFYTNGSFITGIVEEIGTGQVRYRTTSAGNPVLVVAERKDL